MILKPPTKAAYQLLHDGSMCMAAMERRGLCIDTAYLDQAIIDTRRDIADMHDQMRQTDVWRIWQREYGVDMNPDSHEQLGYVVFNQLGFKRNPYTVTKNKARQRDSERGGQDDEDRASNSEKAFKHVDHPFVGMWFEAQKLEKAVGTFLLGIKKETVDGVLHPFYDLHTAASYRSSSSRPNLQNIPRRNKRIAEIVRKAIVPRRGYVLIPADYSGNEVCESINYHHDPEFERYVTGGGDMHRDVARDIFLLSDTEIGPRGSQTEATFRDCSKNKCVFPGFYGASYVTIAPDVWAFAQEFKLKTAQGLDIFEHLKRKGIKSLGACTYQDSNGQPREPAKGTMELLVKNAQAAFWKRFSVYARWKQDWWEAYQRDGGFSSISGFCYQGIFQRNQVLCSAIQGSAFHRLLWCMIGARKEMLRRKMKSGFVLQIHDDAVGEVWESELPDYIALWRDYAEVKVRDAWPGIVCPLRVDFSICRTSWFAKEKLKT